MSRTKMNGDSRSERAIVDTLREKGPMKVKALAQAASAKGPDAPTITPTVSRMIKAGQVAIMPGQRHGLPLVHIIVGLPS